jgi:hypothetical protein
VHHKWHKFVAVVGAVCAQLARYKCIGLVTADLEAKHAKHATISSNGFYKHFGDVKPNQRRKIRVIGKLRKSPKPDINLEWVRG